MSAGECPGGRPGEPRSAKIEHLADAALPSPGEEDAGSIIKRFVDPLLKDNPGGGDKTGLSTDKEHAESVALVLTPDTPVYIHKASPANKNLREQNFILENGRIFMNFDSPYDSSKLPAINLRPIDGGTSISFLVRVFLYPRADLPDEDGRVQMTIRVPVIFRPRVEVDAVSVENRKLPHRLSEGPSGDEFTLEFTLPRPYLEAALKSRASPAQVVVGGEIVLKAYEPEGPVRHQTMAEMSRMEGSLVGLSRLIEGRDFSGEAERQELVRVARETAGAETDPMEVVKRVNRYVSESVKYFRNSMRRTAAQVLEEGIGDCDDYTRVMVALLRAVGIPCKAAYGNIYDFSNYGAHSWVEAALLDKKGERDWFICDPTLATVSTDKDHFVRFKNRIYLYPLVCEVMALNLPVDYSTDILLNWVDDSRKKNLSYQAYQSFINSFRENLARGIDESAAALQSVGAGNLPRREFLFAMGSPYILLDLPASATLYRFNSIREPDRVIKVENSADKEKARWQIKIDGQDNLVLEVGVTDEDSDLESPEDRLFITLLQATYKELRRVLLHGAETRHCLEMTYSRDRYTDRLQKATVRVSRYLTEQHFDRVLDVLAKAGLISPDDRARLEQFYKTAKGKNFYYLLEKCRARGK